ncbi:uncharacterized protein LOC109535894 isoform X1 [Dendroctonus ponderosae]|uniref:uncharacterized protein LOC109535894 isoform X1 n=2 Tax=Dendroctonus ponderosae TaxID=77166 RepID=UPI002034F823|nr:uncharacterized protein LOC109535894 isoform X1 [Dendroctonus ponderosae]XP_048525561.1 uncharacterized protein LOC109535894 isoform X1 [Dendroctonus ponderosae]KAH1008338.1 hypothetical protein HUJ05_008899 [Dendroctonus ponderosae]
MEDKTQIFLCGICKGPSFSTRFSLRAHVKKFHPGKVEELVPKKTYNISAVCDKCNKAFSQYSSMRQHVRNFHPDEIEVLSKYKCYPYKCPECPKQFSGVTNFNAHKKIHQTKIVTGNRSNQLKCPLCKYEDNLKSKLIHHFEENHQIVVKSENMQFDSEEQFDIWKLEEEKSTKSCFIKKRGAKTTLNGTKTTYVCHRSGKYISKGKGERNLKCQGSNKINAFCPAGMSMTQKANICSVDYIKTHVGHQNDLAHLFLSYEDKQKIASKIAENIPLSVILDEVRDSTSTTKTDRIHLLTKKDLFNIKQTNNLNARPVRHRNEAISVQTWVDELQKSNCVVFYKAQDELCEGYPHLKSQDFLLILMTDGPKEMLNKFGRDCICIDGTFGSNCYGFDLVTLLVLDDMREGFPCSFLISSRTDAEVMSIFFYFIGQSLETQVSPKVFMSDTSESFFKAWLRVMGPPKYRLFCTWHVERAWKENLTKITSKETEVLVHQQLRTLLEETDKQAFSVMLNTFLNSLSENESTLDFLNYFKANFANKAEAWANCYRLHTGLDTNIHIERMHHTIKNIYLNGKHKRLDKAINAVLKFVRDQLFDRLITVQKGKLCGKLRELKSRHQASQKLNSNLVMKIETGWQVPSNTTQELYFVEQRKLHCNCKIICQECDACLHQYSCTCIDSSVRYNMCKHIHLVCTHEKHLLDENCTLNDIQEMDIDQADDTVVIQESTCENEIEDLVSKENRRDISKLDQDKLYLKHWVCAQIDRVSTVPEFIKVKDIIAPVEAALNTIKVYNSRPCKKTRKSPHNKNIDE